MADICLVPQVYNAERWDFSDPQQKLNMLVITYRIIHQQHLVRSRIIGTLDENEQKRLYKIKNWDKELYVMLKHI